MRNRRLAQRGDRGAVLIIVAVFMFVAVVMTAAVIDLGNQRQEVKQVTLSTDAAALAAASAIDFSDSPGLGQTVDCGSVDSKDARFTTVHDVATKYWADNGGAGTIDCELVFHPVHRRTAYATVKVVETVDFAFAGATGVESGYASGTSSALVSDPSGGNLYPVAMCGVEATAALSNPALFDENGRSVSPSGVDDEAAFTNAACGGSGNFRQVNFDPSLPEGNECAGPPPGRWCYDFENGGYPGAPAVVKSDTGTNWNRAEDGIEPLVNDGTHIWIVAAQYLDGQGGGPSGATYDVTHFVEVALRSVSNQSMEFTVFQIVPYDPAGPPALTNENPVNAHLCATGPDKSGCTYTYVPPSGEGPGDVDFEDPSTCEPSTVQLTPAPTRQGANLANDLGVDVSVVDPAECTNLSVRVERVVGGQTLDPETCCSLVGQTYSGSFRRNPGGWTWSAGEYYLKVFDGATERGSFDFAVP